MKKKKTGGLMDTKPKTKKITCVDLLFFLLRSNLRTANPIKKKHELLHGVWRSIFSYGKHAFFTASGMVPFQSLPFKSQYFLVPNQESNT